MKWKELSSSSYTLEGVIYKLKNVWVSSNFFIFICLVFQHSSALSPKPLPPFRCSVSAQYNMQCMLQMKVLKRWSETKYLHGWKGEKCMEITTNTLFVLVFSFFLLFSGKKSEKRGHVSTLSALCCTAMRQSLVVKCKFRLMCWYHTGFKGSRLDICSRHMLL